MPEEEGQEGCSDADDDCETVRVDGPSPMVRWFADAETGRGLIKPLRMS